MRELETRAREAATAAAMAREAEADLRETAAQNVPRAQYDRERYVDAWDHIVVFLRPSTSHTRLTARAETAARMQDHATSVAEVR